MAAPGRCEHPHCGRAATQAVQIADILGDLLAFLGEARLMLRVVEDR